VKAPSDWGDESATTGAQRAEILKKFKFQECYNAPVSILSNKGPTDLPGFHGITISAGNGLKQKLCSSARGG
jgi:hypothetical protein